MNTLEMKNRANKAHVLDMLEKARRIILGEVVIQELEEINKGKSPSQRVNPNWPELDPLMVQSLERIGFTITDGGQLVFSISETGLAYIPPRLIDDIIVAVDKGFPTRIPKSPHNGRTYMGNGGSIDPGWSVPYAYSLPEGRHYEILINRIKDMSANVQRSTGKIHKAFTTELELLYGAVELM